MRWLNIDVTLLRSPDFIGVEPVARATWLCLLGYCVDQENSGVIPDCESWGDRRWMQTCAVTRAEIDASKPLAWWKDSALVIAYYPTDKENEVKAKREAGRKGGRPKAESKKEPCGFDLLKASENQVVQKTENGKEGEGEGERKENVNTSVTGVTEIDIQFDEFWKVYPKRVEKKPAYQKFVKAVKKYGFEKIMEGLKNSLPLFEVQGMQFTKNPATWLNKESFMDDPIEIQKQVYAKKQQNEKEKPKEKKHWPLCDQLCKYWDSVSGRCKRYVKEEPFHPESCNIFREGYDNA